MCLKDYYVYLYLRESDGTPYYVGKGRGNRYKKRHRVNIPPKKENIVFVVENVTNDEACFLETVLIKYYGRKDIGTGCLQNQTEGGDGGDTSKSENYQIWLNGIARNENSSYIKDLSLRMRKNNPMFDPDVYAKCHNKEVYEKISKSLKGRKLSDQHKNKIKQAIQKQSDEISIRTKIKWEDEEYKNKTKSTMKNVFEKLKMMTEEEFYEWVYNKKLFTYDNGKKRPNGRVKKIIDYFGKTDEFYSEYFKEKEKNAKKSYEYYKNSTLEEFDEWIKRQKLYRKDGNINPKVYSVVKHRNMLHDYYQKNLPEVERPNDFPQ
jgi:hypothetical protein